MGTRLLSPSVARRLRACCARRSLLWKFKEGLDRSLCLTPEERVKGQNAVRAAAADTYLDEDVEGALEYTRDRFARETSPLLFLLLWLVSLPDSLLYFLPYKKEEKNAGIKAKPKSKFQVQVE